MRKPGKTVNGVHAPTPRPTIWVPVAVAALLITLWLVILGLGG